MSDEIKPTENELFRSVLENVSHLPWITLFILKELLSSLLSSVDSFKLFAGLYTSVPFAVPCLISILIG